MKLLIVSPSFYPALYYGGPIYSSYNLALKLAGNNINIFVATTNSNGKRQLDVKTNKFIKLKANLLVKYYKCKNNMGLSIYMLSGLRNDIRQADIIYVISIFSPTTLITLMWNIIFRKPIIIAPRGQLGVWCLKARQHIKESLVVFNNYTVIKKNKLALDFNK